VVAALSARALRANLEAFDPLVEEITPFPGARTVCRWMRELLAGDRAPARLQDPFGLRCLPQVHGPVLDGVEGLDAVVGRLANVAAENPVVRPDAPDVVHHGGFHTAYLGLSLDAATLAVAASGASVLGRLAHLLEPLTPGGPAFLADGVPGSSGAMGLEFVAASAVGGLRALAVPAGLQTVTLSRGVEDDASFASLSARQAREAVPRYATLLACELVAAVRSLRLQDSAEGADGAGPPAVSARLADALVLCRDLPDSPADRDLTPDLDLATALLDPLAALLA
jgi:histidine ammonia-lyase